MKLIQAVLLVVACSLPCAAQTGVAPPPPPPPAPAVEYNPASWKEFVSEDGRFSVLFPGAPERRVTGEGTGEVHIYRLRTFADYSVTYADLPEPPRDAEQLRTLLDRGRDSWVRSVRGRLVEERDITLDGHPGRQARVAGVGGHTFRNRIYVVGRRVYLISILVRDEGAPEPVLKFHEEVASKFLDSFRLLPATSWPASPTRPEPAPALTPPSFLPFDRA